MITITFQASDVSDLKLKIQEYSLAHLGLKLMDMAEGLTARKMEISVKRSPGRQVGWRKKKEALSTEGSQPNAQPTAPESFVAGATSTTDQSRAKAWLQRVVEAQGLLPGKEILSKLGVDHFDKVSGVHYDELVRLCKEALNEQ